MSQSIVRNIAKPLHQTAVDPANHQASGDPIEALAHTLYSISASGHEPRFNGLAAASPCDATQVTGGRGPFEETEV